LSQGLALLAFILEHGDHLGDACLEDAPPSSDVVAVHAASARPGVHPLASLQQQLRVAEQAPSDFAMQKQAAPVCDFVSGGGKHRSEAYRNGLSRAIPR
jgi:hypothetical protein